MVIVTHDAKLASQAHRVVKLHRGKIDSRTESDDLVEEVDL